MGGRPNVSWGLALSGFVTLAAAAGNEPGTGPRGSINDKDRAVLARLDEPLTLKFEAAPLKDVLRFIKGASQGPNDTGIPIYVDPEGLKRAGVTVMTPVTIDAARVPLKLSLDRLLGPIGLTYRVEGGLLKITAKAIDRAPQAKALLAALDSPVELHFKELPLEEALQFIKAATKGPDYAGIPIYVDPVGLQEAEKTMTSPVTIDAKAEPLKASLKRLLKPLGMTYMVRDGLLLVTSVESVDEPLGVPER